MPTEASTPAPLVTSDEMTALQASFADQAVIALDTEFNRTNTYRPQLCLLQLAATDTDALVDMLTDADYAPVIGLLRDSPGLKLFHAAKQDMEALQTNLSVLPNRIFDTQIGAGLLGHPPQAGYGTLVAEILGVELAKSATRTDWSRRPLSETQLRYALDDVVYLLELYYRLEEKLKTAGRYEWAAEDSATMLDPSLYRTDPMAAWERLGGLHFLPVPVQVRARQLAAWREERAVSIDRPRQWVLSDKALLNLAATDPEDAADLARIPDLPPAIARRQSGPLLAALAQANKALNQGEVDLQRAARPEPPDKAALKNLARVVGDHAEGLGVAPEVLATRKELAGILRGELEQRATSGWRREIIGKHLLAAV